MSDWIIFESLFVFAIWMQRKHRWAIFGQAMGGKYTVAGSVRAGSQAFQYTTANDGTVQAPSGSGSPGASGGSPGASSGSKPCAVGDTSCGHWEYGPVNVGGPNAGVSRQWVTNS